MPTINVKLHYGRVMYANIWHMKFSSGETHCMYEGYANGLSTSILTMYVDVDDKFMSHQAVK